MTKNSDNKRKFYTQAFMNNKSNVSTMTIGALALGGALIGAGVWALSDHNKRRMLSSKMYDARDFALDTFSAMNKDGRYGKYADMVSQATTGSKRGKVKKILKGLKSKKLKNK